MKPKAIAESSDKRIEWREGERWKKEKLILPGKEA